MSDMDIEFIKKSLRRGFLKYPSRKAALNKARRPGNKFECCKCHNLFSRRGIQCDHIIPVGSFDNWDSYIARLFTTVDNLQILCTVCHRKKTNIENANRRTLKARSKKEKSMTIVQLARRDREILELGEFLD